MLRYPAAPAEYRDGEYGSRPPAAGKVWRGESVEAVGMGFGGAVAAEQSIVEEQRHFVNRIVGGDVQGVEQASDHRNAARPAEFVTLSQ